MVRLIQKSGYIKSGGAGGYMAKNLLAYSDFSYIRIATSLGFSSQSHLGAEFKKMTGMTLRAYRLANSEDDFVKESMEWFEDK